MTQDYIAYVYGRIPGMAGLVIVDIYAARTLECLTSMIVGRGLYAGETVRYSRQSL